MTDLQEVYDALLGRYGAQGWWPLIDRTRMPMVCYYTKENTSKIKAVSEVFEICIGAILTQNTNWFNAEKALISLNSAGYLNPEILSGANPEVIADLIASSGYYNQKTRKIKTFSSFFLTHPKPDRELLLAQWGLGPETVDDMLLYAYDQPVFVIDLYTRRLFSRLGLCTEKISYDELQTLITNGIENDVTLYKEYHALIVRNAKEHCKKTPACDGCPAGSFCNVFSQR